MRVSSTTTDPARDWRALREAHALSLNDVARRTGINKGRLSQVETRDLRVTPEMARALLAVYEEAQR